MISLLFVQQKPVGMPSIFNLGNRKLERKSKKPITIDKRDKSDRAANNIAAKATLSLSKGLSPPLTTLHFTTDITW